MVFIRLCVVLSIRVSARVNVWCLTISILLCYQCVFIDHYYSIYSYLYVRFNTISQLSILFANCVLIYPIQY